ncbi:MAG: hypothetical protein LC808_41725, partial [Actinobacteria bacterium]|nr:hypothetical protein [Actinomycetota bacterium]
MRPQHLPAGHGAGNRDLAQFSRRRIIHGASAIRMIISLILVLVFVVSCFSMKKAFSINPWGVAVTPDGRHVYLTNADTPNLSVIETVSNTAITTTIPDANGLQAVAITPDGRRAYVTSDDTGTHLDV